MDIHVDFYLALKICRSGRETPPPTKKTAGVITKNYIQFKAVKIGIPQRKIEQPDNYS